MVRQLDIDWDVCARKSRGNAERAEANAKAAGGKRDARLAVLALIRQAQGEGMTCKEVAARLGKWMNAVSGRFSELKALGIVRQAGRREGCGVYVGV
jgi:predicted transcriptional regulator